MSKEQLKRIIREEKLRVLHEKVARKNDTIRITKGQLKNIIIETILSEDDDGDDDGDVSADDMDQPMYESQDKSNSLAEKTANMNNVELKDAYRDAKKIKKIADELGVSEKAVKGEIASELKGRGKL